MTVAYAICNDSKLHGTMTKKALENQSEIPGTPACHQQLDGHLHALYMCLPSCAAFKGASSRILPHLM